MRVPFAEYTLTAKPDWLRSSLRVGETIAIDPSRRFHVSRRQEDEVFVQGDERLFALGWGGTRNHMISWERDAWVVHHLGHHSPIWINNQPTRAHRHTLASGDRVAPALGLVFTFKLRPDLEDIADELAQLKWAPAGDERVLGDWVMERRAMDRDAASLAARHLMIRSAVDRTG